MDEAMLNNSVIALALKDKQELQRRYMPFIKGGGIFIATKKQYLLGQTIMLDIRLLNELERYRLRSRVVWITPNCAHGARISGIGVQLLEGQLNVKIKAYLASMQRLGAPTDTM